MEPKPPSLFGSVVHVFYWIRSSKKMGQKTSSELMWDPVSAETRREIQLGGEKSASNG